MHIALSSHFVGEIKPVNHLNLDSSLNGRPRPFPLCGHFYNSYSQYTGPYVAASHFIPTPRCRAEARSHSSNIQPAAGGLVDWINLNQKPPRLSSLDNCSPMFRIHNSRAAGQCAYDTWLSRQTKRIALYIAQRIALCMSVCAEVDSGSSWLGPPVALFAEFQDIVWYGRYI